MCINNQDSCYLDLQSQRQASKQDEHMIKSLIICIYRSTRGLGTRWSNIGNDSCFSDGWLSCSILISKFAWRLSEHSCTKAYREDDRTHEEKWRKNNSHLNLSRFGTTALIAGFSAQIYIFDARQVINNLEYLPRISWFLQLDISFVGSSSTWK